MKTLSLGIPTFNRKNIIKANLIDLLSDNFLYQNDIDLIVSDNKSTDGTFNILKKIKLIKNVDSFYIQQNKKNLGVFKNIFKIFKSCNSKYLMIISDEEFVYKENIPKLIDFLEKYKPSFVSTQFLLNKKIYRGSKKLKKILPNEWFVSSFYISGLVFDVKAVNSIIDKNFNLLTKENLYYVQSLILCELMIKKAGSQWWLNLPLVKKKFNEPTTISMTDKHQYWTLPGRCNSFLAIENYFKLRDSKIHPNKLIKVFKKKNREYLYRYLVQAIVDYNPEILKDFKHGVMKVEFRFFSILFLMISKLLISIIALLSLIKKLIKI